MNAPPNAEMILVCSSGGHLQQMLALQPVWGAYSHVWVTFDKSDARSLLADEDVVYAHGPTNRSVKNLLRNLALAWRVITELRPKAIVTTGAGVAVPFAWVGRLRGADVVYIESLARVRDVSLSCRLIAPLAARIYVQSPDLVEAVPRARYAGTVFADV